MNFLADNQFINPKVISELHKHFVHQLSLLMLSGASLIHNSVMDPNKTCCYNLLCAGFIQTSTAISLGISLHPVSSYGEDQYDMFTDIYEVIRDGIYVINFKKILNNFYR
ncbi:hypothetical protein AMTRI_Chr02g223240 [Amborella trichopoda]